MKINLREMLRSALGDRADEEYIDTVLEGLGRRLQESSEERMRLHEKKMQYHQEAKEVANQGKPFHHLLRKSELMQLLKMRVAGAEKVEVSSGACCQECKEHFHNAVYDLDEAIESPPVPYEGCTRWTQFEEYVEGWCVCGCVIHMD